MMKATRNDVIKILLVEDNPGDARLFREFLKDAGSSNIDLTHTDYLEDALKLTDKDDYDLILLDLSLPDANGLETVNKTHEHVPDLPIVVLTGLNNEEIAVKAVQAGAQDYLVKGQVDSHLLIRAIRYAIERKRTELDHKDALTKASESERLSTIGTLAAGIAHELNQPLQTFKFSISNLRQMQNNNSLTAETLLEKLEKMDQLTNYMSSIITNLLGYVKADEIFDRCSLSDILNTVMSMIGKQLSKQGIEVELDIPADFAIYCNRSSIAQVVMNLFINARDAYLEKEQEPEAETERKIFVYTSTNDDAHCIYVKDWAGGIPTEIRNRVFDPFISTKSAVKGTGMGLHVVKQIMVRHDGNVSFTVEDEVGTIFELMFPKYPSKMSNMEKLVVG